MVAEIWCHGPTWGNLKVNVDRLGVRIVNFNSKICLRNVKQLAVLLSPILSRSCCLCRSCDTSANPPLLKWSCAAQLETRFSPAGMPSALHTCSMQGFRFFPASVVTLVSGEVKHVVHLIHLNWNSCLLPMWFDRQRSRLTEWRANF